MCSRAMPGAVVWSSTESDSYRRRIGCGTLASDTKRVKRAAHVRQARTATPRSRGVRHVAASGPKRREHQVGGGNADDSPLLVRSSSRIRIQDSAGEVE